MGSSTKLLSTLYIKIIDAYKAGLGYNKTAQHFQVAIFQVINVIKKMAVSRNNRRNLWRKKVQNFMKKTPLQLLSMGVDGLRFGLLLGKISLLKRRLNELNTSES